jgi:glycosyltransferase involved in cell wall biosynthesis
MHVGLNLVFLVPGEQGGMETYARRLIPELAAAAPEDRFTAFVSREAAAADGPWHNLSGGAVTVPVSSRNRIEWVRGEQLLLPGLARRAGVELVHSLASTAPARGRFRRVVTIHDLIYRTIPEAHPGVRSLGMRVLVPLGAHRADRVIADSRATAADVRRHLRIPAERIDVVPLGLGAARVAPLAEAELRTRLDAGARPILLSVSAKLAHKNLSRLIDALARVQAPSRPLLVLPGYPTPHEDELRARARARGVAGDVRFLGWVDAAELEGLYAAAAAFVFPTLAEGFGLPVLEAMARRVPVACSDLPVLREVAGDAARYFDPRSEDAIAAAIRALLDDRAAAERLAAAGPERAAGFSWRRTAELTLAAYRRARP